MTGSLEDTAGKASVSNLRAASEDIDRVLTVLPERMLAIIDAMNGHPAGRGFDSQGGRSSTSFCEVHGQERCPCGSGTTYAHRSDPTGEIAGLPDRAKRDHDRVVALAKSIRRQSDELAAIVARYASRQPTVEERRQTLADNERDVSCWSCARDRAHYALAHRTAEVAGERRQLCWWCFDWMRKGDGSPPTVDQVRQYHDTGRVRRRTA